MGVNSLKPIAHVVDVLGNVIGRDQPLMRMDKALSLTSLLNTKIFEDENVVFFDPFCKAGEILLACALHSCRAKSKTRLHDTELILSEIYKSNKYFGLAPDERHHRLSLRTFLGNKNSHDPSYNHVIRDGLYLSEIDGRLDRKKFQKEFNLMIEYIKSTAKNKRIICVGNPPYQESDKGFGKSAKSIYDYFTQILIDSKDVSEFVLVIPARWFGGGKGLDNFREIISTSGKVKNLRYFKNSSEVFPTVDINGGVCFLHYDKTFEGKTLFTDGKNKIELNLSQFDIITDDPLGYSLVKKILNKWAGEYISNIAWARKPFGLETDYFNKHKSINKADGDAIACLSRNKQIKYLKRDSVPKNKDKINLWKVSVPAVAGGVKGNRRSTIPLNQIFLLPKGTISTETYSVIDAFKSKEEAENLISYLKTDFARYFLGLRKMTQHLPRDRWSWVPYLDTSKSWTDDEIFKMFGLTNDEKKHIRDKVREWSC